MRRASKTAFLLRLVMFILLLGSLSYPMAQGHASTIEGAVREAKEAGIDESSLNSLLILGYEKRVDPASMVNLVRILAQAQRENIPLQPFVSKIKEGMAKNVPGPRIEQVVMRKIDDYRFVRSAVNDFMQKYGQRTPIPDELIVRLTETLYCGLSRDDVRRVMEQAPSAPLPALTRGAEVLASLKQINFEPKLSDQIVFKGLNQNYFNSEQRDFVRVIAVAKEKGVSDGQIAAAALSAMEGKGSASNLSSQLGVTAQDLGHHGGPQVGSGASGPGMGSSSGMGAGMGGSGGMGGMGGAQPLAATMNGARFLGIDVDPVRIQRRIDTGYCDRIALAIEKPRSTLRANPSGRVLS